MVEMKSEIQSNPTESNSAHPNLERNIFESAYSGQLASSEGPRIAFNSTARPPIESAWPPPLEVADAAGNIITTKTEDKPGTSEPDKAEGQHSADAPEAKEEGKPPEGETQPAKADEASPKGDEQPGKPEDKSTDKPVDPNLPPELQNEAQLMKNLTGQQKTLIETAFKAVGTPLWAESEYADITGNGRYGCAASESIIKQRAGYDYADSPLVSGLVNQLQKNGWTKHPFAERQPGDTVIRHKAGQQWKKGGGNAHIGTVGADINYAYNNNSDSATWSYKPIDESFSPRSKRFVLRPPAASETLVAKGQ